MAKRAGPPTAAQRAAVANEYLNAAREHLARLDRLYEAGDFALCLFLSGLAVECILRAYRVRLTPEFSSRHDLADLAREADFASTYPPRREIEYGQALQRLASVWSSNDRYRPASAVRSRLRRVGVTRGRRVDLLRDVARRSIVDAHFLANLGFTRWQSERSHK